MRKALRLRTVFVKVAGQISDIDYITNSIGIDIGNPERFGDRTIFVEVTDKRCQVENIDFPVFIEVARGMVSDETHPAAGRHRIAVKAGDTGDYEALEKAKIGAVADTVVIEVGIYRDWRRRSALIKETFEIKEVGYRADRTVAIDIAIAIAILKNLRWGIGFRVQTRRKRP
jgi:hypothetical protein